MWDFSECVIVIVIVIVAGRLGGRPDAYICLRQRAATKIPLSKERPDEHHAIVFFEILISCPEPALLGHHCHYTSKNKLPRSHEQLAQMKYQSCVISSGLPWDMRPTGMLEREVNIEAQPGTAEAE